MRFCRLVVLVLTLSTAPIASNPAEGSDSTARDELIQIEHQLAVAWPKGDKQTIDRILAPDWSVTNALGQVQTKEQVLRDAFQSGILKVRSAKLDEINVRLFGNTAVATGQSVSEGLYAGTPFGATLRFTDVFVKRKRHWQAVASHACAIRQ